MRPDRAAARRAAELAWKAPFVLASTLMLGAGAAQSLGRSGVPPLAALGALALAGLGTVLAVAATWRPRRPRPLQALRAVPARLGRARTRLTRLTRTLTAPLTRNRKARS